MFIFLSKLLPLFVYPLGLSVLLILLSLFLSKRVKIQRTGLLFALLILWLSSTRWVSYSLVRSLEWQYLPPAELPTVDAIVVLGGGTEPRQPPRPTVEMNGAGDRALYAAYLYRQGKAPVVLVSGGNIEFLGARQQTPAQDMLEVLEMAGVPAEAVWLQPESRNTYEDALYTHQMLEERHISRVILVTSAMHMPRSVALFRKQGVDVIPAPTDFHLTDADWQALWHPNLSWLAINLLPDAGSLATTTSAMKEYIGIFIYRLRGWL
jgi:uncharacterized SAM-binding protein YcdF (DUF218 family)